MSTLCIGGVCVPYTAVVPLFFICLRWLVQKAVEFGLLPKSIQEKLGASKYEPTPGETKCCAPSNKNGTVVEIESEDQFRQVLQSPLVVCKFTAEWCRPCKEIHPLYVTLAGKHTNATFCTVDVDDHEEISSEYNVAMMPTFLVFQNGKAVKTKTGIDLLEDFLQKTLA